MQNFIQLALRKRRELDLASAGYLRWLSKWEKDHINLWRLSYKRFTDILEEHQLCSTGDYRRYKHTASKLGDEVVATIGLDAAKRIVRLDNEDEQQTAIEHVRIWVRDGNPIPTKEKAALLVNEAVPSRIIEREPRKPAPNLAVKLREALIENHDLRVENRTLRATIAKQAAKLAKYETRASKDKKPTKAQILKLSKARQPEAKLTMPSRRKSLAN